MMMAKWQRRATIEYFICDDFRSVFFSALASLNLYTHFFTEFMANMAEFNTIILIQMSKEN